MTASEINEILQSIAKLRTNSQPPEIVKQILLLPEEQMNLVIDVIDTLHDLFDEVSRLIDQGLLGNENNN